VTTWPGALPRYRLLTDADSAASCHRVRQALDSGYRLHGSPCLAFVGDHVVVAQALLWSVQPVREQPAPL
jgi:hypothetical protein